MNSYESRLQKCAKGIEQSEFSHLVVSSTPNLVYLTGQRLDTGERMVALILQGESCRPKLFIHEMFANLTEPIGGVDFVLWSDDQDPVALLGDTIADATVVGVDGTWQSEFLLGLLHIHPYLHVVQSRLVETMREVKEESEIDVLRQSSRIADAVLHEVVQLQTFPASERQVAESVRQLFNEHQVSALAFPPIIGFGSNSANPHHLPGEYWTRPDQAIVFDIGGVYQDYCSDITRTVYFGHPNAHYEEIYKILQEAHEAALSQIHPGMMFSELDIFIRNQLAKKGYDKYFIHRTGHGLGLEAHEGPSIHQNNHSEMKEGMVFTVEPGIYLPKEFGIRIEDVVVVTDSGCEILTRSPRGVQYMDVFV